MTRQPRELGQLQRWMQSVIKHPDGIEAGIADVEAQAEIEVGVDEVSDVICRSRAQTSIERLAIYGNAYYARLLECLRDEYPALLNALGEEIFDGFAFGYLQAYPSKSYTLASLGSHFAEYLRETRPPREQGASEPDWADLMVDLATLERAYAEIFDGPGTEGERCLEARELLAIAPNLWPDAKLVTAPCLRLMRFDFPVHEYATAVRHDESPELPAAAETFLALTRRDFVVRRVPLSETQYKLLGALADGSPLAAALFAATSDAPVSDEQLGQLLRSWFEEWTAARLFVRVELPA